MLFNMAWNLFVEILSKLQAFSVFIIVIWKILHKILHIEAFFEWTPSIHSKVRVGGDCSQPCVPEFLTNCGGMPLLQFFPPPKNWPPLSIMLLSPIPPQSLSRSNIEEAVIFNNIQRNFAKYFCLLAAFSEEQSWLNGKSQSGLKPWIQFS